MTDKSKIAAAILIGLGLTLLLIALAWRGHAQRQRRSSGALGAALDGGLTALDGQIVDKFLFAKASVTGAGGQPSRPVWFMIDSGNSACDLDADFAREAGISATGSTQFEAGGTSTVPLAAGVDFAIQTGKDGSAATLPLTNQTVILLKDTSLIASIQGGQSILAEGYGGVLGMPFLSTYNLVADYTRGQLHVAPDTYSGQLEVPLHVVSGRSATDPAPVNAASVPVFVGLSSGGDGGPWPTTPSHWLIDLGADRSTISMAGAHSIGAAEWQRAVASAPVSGEERLATKTVQVREVADATLSLQSHGGATLRQLPLKVPSGAIAGVQGRGGDLGADYFSRLGTVGFLFKDKRLVVA